MAMMTRKQLHESCVRAGVGKHMAGALFPLRAHITPDPDGIPPDEHDPVPEEPPLPSPVPVEEPTPPMPPMQSAKAGA